MTSMTARNYATFFMDCASVFLCGGMIMYTSLYRRRGRGDDRCFFLLLLSVLGIGISDAMVAFFDGEGFPAAGVMTLLFLNAFYIFEVLSVVLLFFFMACRLNQDSHKLPKRLLPAALPALLVIASYIAGYGGRYFLTIDEGNNYGYGPYYLYPVLILALYALAVFGMGIVYKKKTENTKYTPLWIYLIPVAAAFLPYLLKGPSLSGISFTVILAYIHTGVMNEQFFAGKKG